MYQAQGDLFLFSLAWLHGIDTSLPTHEKRDRHVYYREMGGGSPTDHIGICEHIPQEQILEACAQTDLISFTGT